MTTADYLESLQNDLQTISEALDLEEGTNFSDIATMANDGEITKGGGSGLDWSALGYSNTPESVVNDYNYSLQIKNNYAGGNFTNNTTLIYMPLVDTSQLTSFLSFFQGCTNLTSVPSLTVSSDVTTLRYMFRDCTNLIQVDFSNFDTSNVTRMDYLFADCKKITTIDLSSFVTENVSNITCMFSGCTSLQFIDLRKADFTNIGTKLNVFSNVPTNCLIIVKDTTQKDWFTTNFPSMTNVQTVAEYEGN